MPLYLSCHELSIQSVTILIPDKPSTSLQTLLIPTLVHSTVLEAGAPVPLPLAVHPVPRVVDPVVLVSGEVVDGPHTMWDLQVGQLSQQLLSNVLLSNTKPLPTPHVIVVFMII